MVGPALLDTHNWRVADVMNGDLRTWDGAKLKEMYTETEVKAITRTRIPRVSHEDTFCWPDEPFGEYSVKSGYRLLRERIEVTAERKALWLKLWRGHLPPKIKIFVWRLLNGILPMRYALFQRNIVLSNLCPTYGEEIEDMDHCLLRCKWACEVWDSSDIHGTNVEFKKILVTLWKMWNCRNICVFQDKVVMARCVFGSVMRLLQQFQQAADGRR